MAVFSDHQPMFVELETTTYCNRRCHYCPNAMFDRGTREHEVRMSTELLTRIV